MRDGQGLIAPITVALMAAFLLSGCVTLSEGYNKYAKPYVNKAKTVISDTLDTLEVEPTGADQPPFNDPA